MGARIRERARVCVVCRACVHTFRLRMSAAVREACRAFSGLPAECIRGPPPRTRWRSLAALAALTAFTTFVITTTPPAYARTAHTYESAITEVPAEGPGGPVPTPGGLEQVNSMTVFSGDLYVAEHLEGEVPSISRTDQFAPSLSGQYEFVSQLPPQPEPGVQNRGEGIAFGSAAGEPEMYLGQGGKFHSTQGVNVFAPGGCGNLECAAFQTLWEGKEMPEETRPFVGVEAVAVDHSTSVGDWAQGDVFVADTGEGDNGPVHPPAIDIFEPQAGGEEHYVGQVTGPAPGQPFAQGLGQPGLSFAVSGFNGDLVASDNTGVYVFRPEEEGAKNGKYVFERQLELPGNGPLTGVGAVAVDDSTVGTTAGEIYVATREAVDEFSPEGVFLGDVTSVPREGTPGGVKGQTEEEPLLPRSLAVDPVSHRVFVGQHGVVDVFGPDLVLPDVVTEAPSNLALESDPETGATSWRIEPTGSVNPLEAGVASCWFAWGLTEAFGQEAPCAAPVSNGASPVHVHAALTGLEPDTAYVYRLQASNANGTNKGEASEDYRFTTPGPGLRSESVSTVTSSSASFEATIAPHDAPVEEHDLQQQTNSPTTYYFQYSTQSTAGCVSEPSACTSVPSSPATIGSGTADVAVSQQVQGLTAGSTYHYRLVAVNEALPAAKPGVLVPFYGQDRTFTTQGPGGPVVLPDGRAWELVSPANKHGAKIAPPGQAAVGGDKFTFLTDEPTGSPPAGNPSQNTQVLSSRVAPGEWASVDIALSRSKPEGVLANGQHEYRFFSEDLGLAVAESEGPFSVPEGWHQNTRGEWERIVESSPVPSERTPYLRHNSTCSSAPASCFEPMLDSEDVTSGQKYEGGGADAGAARFVAATPDASHVFIHSSVRLTTAVAPDGGLYEWTAGAPAAQRLSLVNADGLLGFSSDGGRLFLAGCGTQEGCREFTVLDMASDEPVPMAPVPGSGIFAGASQDGSRAFFTYDTALTRGASPQGHDLYVCELGAVGAGRPECVLRDLTPGPAAGQPGANESAEVTQALGVSRDGSYVYFLAKGVRAAGASPGENVYVAHEHEGIWTTTFIASAHVHPVDEGTPRAVSPDGRWFAFSTETPLAGYDNRDAKTGAPDSEVYLYDAASDRFVCASCNPSGARPTGPSEVGGSRSSLFDNGRLFFNSADALVAQDTNGNLDVYEFEPAGVGSCTSASVTFNAGTGGCVGLISSGVAPGASVFLDASGTGADAFFTTRERLVGKDVDTAVDIYDAHVCSGSSDCPSEAEVPPACTTADACRPAPAPQPSIFGPPSSATFSGQGNAASPPSPRPAKTAAQIRAEKLKKALKACKKIRARRRRVACKRKAHRRYGPVKSSRVANAKRGA
jgi:predicted secreted protein